MIEIAGDDVDVPEELLKMVDEDATEEEGKDSIMGQIQNLQNMDIDQLKEKASATVTELKSKAEEKCSIMWMAREHVCVGMKMKKTRKWISTSYGDLQTKLRYKVLDSVMLLYICKLTFITAHKRKKKNIFLLLKDIQYAKNFPISLFNSN